MNDALSNLPPYVKYVVVTLIPWIELRGAIPWAVGAGDLAYIPIIVVTNVLIFFPTYFILEWIYEHIPEGSWLHRKLENVRAKAHPLVEKYGFFGLALFVGIPLPGT
ncbi:MAG: small multi-drug export protein, partial [Coriobacteriia bacterium]|nr:small multi-drug export protein [Coriobacteriia bacterium]